MPSKLPTNTTDLFNQVTGIGHISGHSAPFDSSSNTSSCNSSTPSSPAVMVVSTPPHSASYRTKFTFPEPIVVSQPNTSNQKPLSPNPIIDSVKSNDSDKTLSGTQFCFLSKIIVFCLPFFFGFIFISFLREFYFLVNVKIVFIFFFAK